MKLHRLRLLLPFLLCLGLLLALTSGNVSAQETSPPAEPDTAARQATATDAPLDCIDPLKAGHIAATIASLVPIPGFKDAADLAAYGLNLELKNCPPHLEPPQDVVLPPPPECVVTFHIPIAGTYNELNQLDENFFEELRQTPSFEGASAVATVRTVNQAIEEMQSDEFGRFGNLSYGSYVNIYGLELPLEFSEFASSDWGSLGQPEIYHYNSDVLITLRHPGERISKDQVQFRPGVHTISWQADTLFSDFDYIYIPNIGGAAAAGKKAAKEGLVNALRNAIRQAIKEAQEQGAKQFAKETAKKVGKELAKRGLSESASILGRVQHPYFVSGDPNATTYVTQRVLVIDANPPTVEGVQPNVQFEAFQPGGIASSGHVADLKEAITVLDDCDQSPDLTASTPAFWPLLADENGNHLPSATIAWTGSDNGARDASGGVNTTTVTQTVTVVDTLPPILVPPSPVIMETEGTVEVPLGTPRVFDVADLRPTIDYTAPGTTEGNQWPVFGQGVHYVEWTATDQSKNQSEVKTQLVNIKEPGTNVPPTAFDIGGSDTIQATADEPITITVRGQDGNDPADPIWFTVDDEPENGFFIAPLYPYFIDDYRMTARYSPQIAQWEGEEFALQVAQSPEAMRQYMIQLCEEDIQRTDLPKDFVSQIDYLAVDDEDYTYIYDSAYRRCTHGGSTIAPNGSERISVWDPEGLYVGEIWRSGGSHPLQEINFNVGQGTILAVNSDGSTTGSSVVNVYTTQPENTDEPIVEEQSYSLWNEINDIYVESEDVWRGPEFKNAASAAWDTKNNVLYVAGEMNLTGLAAFQPTLCNNVPNSTTEDLCLDLIGVPVYSMSIVQSTKTGDFPGVGVDAMRLWNINDLAVDSTGALYVVANSPDPANSGSHNFHRIYKFAPATVSEDGSMIAGELIGWMGKCSSGPNCNYIDGHSIGFSCTDETCAVEGELSGSGPGQFNSIAAIAIDPNDVLYVADSGNERVQRFTDDGLFAGEARSQSSCEGCSGFVLGDFGAPGNIAVNSNQFYILDIDTELVHVFEASVIHSIDDSSAWVEYQSDTNYVGADFFTFKATDGFRTAEGELIESDPARVDVQVSRNFRPPQATAGLFISTTEDTPAGIALDGYDLDGELDTLTYRVETPPSYGELSGAVPDLTYTPNPDFFGNDAFTFVVNDGREESEPELVPVSVDPANDPSSVVIEGEPLSAGVGFPFTLDAIIVDADYDDEHALQVNWGVGTVEEEGSYTSDGEISGPVLTANETITSTVLGYHTYTSPGDSTLTVCATDRAGVESCDSRTVSVQNGVDLVLSQDGGSVVPSDRRTFTYALTVGNRNPSTGGVPAADVVLQETLAPGATYQQVSTNGPFTCSTAGQTLHCPIGDLALGSQTQVIITVSLDDTLEPGAEIEASSRVESSTPEVIPDSNELLVNLTLLPAADFLVTSLEDSGDTSPGDGACTAASGGCTLRAAVQEANSLAEPQSIALGYGVHQLNLQEEAGRLRAISEALSVTDDLTILGLNPDRTIVNANGLSRIFDLNGASLTLQDLMLSGGAAGEGDGGAVRAIDSDLRLERVAVAGNQATNGGGLALQNGTAFIEASAFTDNHTTSGGSGGAIHNQGAEVTVQNSTFNGNQADLGGALFHTSGTVSFQNATLVGNSASAEGGGLHSTGNGVSLVNTILAGNSAPLGSGCLGRFAADGPNLVGDLDSCTVLGQTSSNVLVQGTEWESLSRSIAGTYAHALFAGSQAIDAGSCLLSTDQQGTERPYGNGCDIGAIEYNPLAGLTESTYLPTVMR